MTIEEMRKEMRREVVPEEVVPQNVINCLIDEDAEPPKPDAFSFLMRLRALGIGSGDFLDLLEGCDAPESVVNKIRQNPAMNLQGLIMTLENSELNSDDYTRMLLTARQVWERTLTLRLEKSEKVSQEIDEEELNNKPVKVYGEPEYNNDSVEEDDYDDTLTDTETEEYDEEDPANEEDEYDEDMLEMSFASILEKINAEALEAAPAEPETEPDAESKPQNADDENGTDDEAQSSADENASGTDKELTFTAAFDKIKAEKQNAKIRGGSTAETPVKAKQPETASDNTDEETDASFVEFDEESLRKNFGKFSEEAESEKTAETPKTAKQKKREEYEDVVDTDAEDDEPEDGGKPRRTYHKGAIIGAAIGAAALVGAGIFIGSRFGGKTEKNLHYAADNYEIFDKIYYAYGDSVPGGDAAVGIEEDHNAIFGDLLLSGEGGKKGTTNLSIGTGLYTITEEAISVSMVENGKVTPLDDLTPPESSRFVAAFDSNGELYALFSGEQSGLIKISDGKAQFTVRQDGALTGYDMSDGEIRLGTVYTPTFRYTFTLNDEDVYLPKLGTDEPKPISAEKVIISDTKGYSYGVSAGYSTENGSLNDVCAVIGDPVAASADGRFALNGKNGVLIKTDGDNISSRQTERLSRAAFGKNGGAIIEEADPENIKMVDAELENASILTGITEDISAMRFDGNILTICCTNSVFGVDCSDFASPAPIKLRTVNGINLGQSALTCEADGSALVITRYDLKNGKAEKTAEYTKSLNSAQLTTVKLGDPKTAVVDGTKSGVSYSYFDGVSVVSEYAVFADGSQPKTVSVFDDKTGFTVAFKNGNAINAVCAEGVKVLQ